jgi:ATP-binding cassette subfamily B protein
MAETEEEVQPSPYALEFESVSFSYLGKSPDLEDISFKLRPGETLGIIGPIGSGKSTIVKLLLRFYDTDRGIIRINGRNIRSIPLDELRTMFGVVFQNDTLFAATIKENVDFGRNATDLELEDALQDAQASEFVDRKVSKISHLLNIKATNLSGGQKQRIFIARALLGKPSFLILDDASSALDYKTDANFRRSLNEDAYKNTTKVITAQRISAIRHAEMILVVDDGRTIGYDTHENLLKTCPMYQEIYETQMGGSREL